MATTDTQRGNLIRLLETQARERPGATALQDGERSWCFAELDAEVARFAGALRGAGLEQGDRIGVCLRDTADHVIARLATGRAGIAVVPMDWRLPLPERATVARRFRLAAVLTEPGGALDGARCIPVDDAWQARVARAAELPFVDDPDLPLVLNLSSGTTGAPKAAIVTHGNFAQRIRNNIADCGSLAGLRYLSVNPLYFSAGSHYCLTALLQGAAVILYPPLFGAEEYVDAVRDHGATMSCLVPTVLRWLLALPASQAPPLLPSLKLLVATGAPLTAEERVQIVKHLTPNFHDIYGSAGCGAITVLRPADLAAHASSVGRATGDVRLQLVDDADRPVAAGDVGRVRVRGAGVSSAWFDTAETGAVGDPGSERVTGGWLYTGDLATLDADGYLTLQGRADDVILRGGANIYPDVIEAALRRCPGVGDAAVTARPVPGGDPEVVAFVVAAGDGATLTQQLLLTHCRGVLPAWMLPAEIRIVDDLPRTTSGKVKRRELLP